MKLHSAPSVKFTYDDLRNFPADGKRHELIDGEHYVTPSPGTKHQIVSMNLTGALIDFLKHDPLGALFAAPLDVLLSELDVVEPDLFYVSREHADLVEEAHLRGAPDLVVEILSPGTRKTDEITKRKLYERYGVAEYWVVDPELESIKVYRRRDEHTFTRAAELSVETGDSLTTPLLPGFSVALSRIFAPAF